MALLLYKIIGSAVDLFDRLDKVLLAVVVDPFFLFRCVVDTGMLSLVAGILLEKFINFHLDLFVLVRFHRPVKILNTFSRIPRPCMTLKP